MSRLLPPAITIVMAVLNIAYVTTYLLDPDILDGLAPIQRVLLTTNAIAALTWIFQAQSLAHKIGYLQGRADEVRELARH